MKSNIRKIFPFLSGYVPDDLALKGISKINPSLGKFLTNGLTKGLSLATGLEYLRNRFFSDEPEIDQTMRSDEKVVQSEKNRYKSMENKIGGAASLGLGLAGGGIASSLASSGIDSLFGGVDQEAGQIGQEMQQQAELQQPTNDPNAIDQVLAEIHESSMGQYIRKSVQQGSDPMEIISTIMRKTPERVHDIEKKTGDKFENVIDAYIKKIMGGSKVQAPEAAPQQQQVQNTQNPDKLMAILQQVREFRKPKGT